jgi:hypothetical protein
MTIAKILSNIDRSTLSQSEWEMIDELENKVELFAGLTYHEVKLIKIFISNSEAASVPVYFSESDRYENLSSASTDGWYEMSTKIPTRITPHRDPIYLAVEDLVKTSTLNGYEKSFIEHVKRQLEFMCKLDSIEKAELNHILKKNNYSILA